MDGVFSSLYEVKKLASDLTCSLRSIDSCEIVYIDELDKYILFPGIQSQDRKMKKNILIFDPKKLVFTL